MNQMEGGTAAAFVSRYVEMDGTRVHYLEAGAGDPVLLLHTIPASSWEWRNIIPYLSPLGRCIAPDLPGFGKSGDTHKTYSLADQIRCVERLIETLQLKRIIFVLHGWGSIAGFDIAMRHENNCRGLVFYESFVCPLVGEHVSLPWKEYIYQWRTAKKLHAVSESAMHFVSESLQYAALQPFTENMLAHYCAPFLEPGSGKSLHQYLLEVPAGEGTSEADRHIAAYSSQLQQSKLPKLMIYSLPGFVTTMETLAWAKAHLPALEVVDVGEALHYAMEAQAEMMGESISAWIQGLSGARGG